MTTAGPLRLLIVDDQALVRAGLALILRTEAGLEVVAEAANGEEAVRTTAAGGSWLDPQVTPRLLDVLRHGGGVRPPNAALERLSERETEVLRLMSAGASNQEIAERLYVSERTVKSHVGAIFTKLEARDRAAAIVLAYQSGLVRPGAGPG